MHESRVVGVYDYPVKGAAGRARRRLQVDPTVGVANDRRRALKKRAGTPDDWAPKSAFFVGVNTALMVAQVPVFVSCFCRCAEVVNGRPDSKVEPEDRCGA